MVFALFFSLGIGALNGLLLIRTRLHSFLVTLGTFLMLQGLNIAITKLITGNVATGDISGMAGFNTLQTIFASNAMIVRAQISIAIVYWLIFVALATWVLLRTKIGNWIFAVGGQGESARSVGVPVNRVKIWLFMLPCPLAMIAPKRLRNSFTITPESMPAGALMAVTAAPGEAAENTVSPSLSAAARVAWASI